MTVADLSNVDEPLNDESSEAGAHAIASKIEAKIEHPPKLWLQSVLTLLVLAAMRLTLMAPFPFALAAQEVDDQLYLELGQSLAQGEWLGPYDGRNLLKEIGFPLFVAAGKSLGIPLRLSQELLWILACGLTYFCLRRLGLNWLSATLATTVLLFHPAAAPGNLERVLREHVYNSQILGLTALAGLAITWRCWWRQLLNLSFLSGLVVWTWHSREEGIWLVPILVTICMALILCQRQRGSLRPGLLAALFLVVMTLGLDLGFRAYVRAMNEKHYGEAVFVETKEEPFRAAVGALIRAETEDEHPYFPVRDATIEELYTVSPTLASIKPTLDSVIYRDGWMSGPDGSRTVCALAWALRAGAQKNGHFASLSASLAFFQSLADELNEHLDQNREHLGPKRSSVFPPLRKQRLPSLAKESYASLRDCWELNLRYVGGVPGLPQMHYDGERKTAALAVLGQEEWPDAIAQSGRRNLLQKLLECYRLISPWLAFFAVVGLVLQIYRQRRLTPILWMLMILAVTVITRAVLIGGLEVWYSPSRSTYLLCAMAPFMLFVQLSCVAGFAALWPESWRKSLARAMNDRRLWLPLLILAAGSGYYWAKGVAESGLRQEVPQPVAARVAAGRTMVMEALGAKVVPSEEGLILRGAAPNPAISARPWLMVPRTGRFDVEIAGRAEGLEGQTMTFVCYGQGPNFQAEFRDHFQVDDQGEFQITYPLQAWSIQALYLGGPIKPGATLKLRRMALVRSP